MIEALRTELTGYAEMTDAAMPSGEELSAASLVLPCLPTLLAFLQFVLHSHTTCALHMIHHTPNTLLPTSMPSGEELSAASLVNPGPYILNLAHLTSETDAVRRGAERCLLDTSPTP